jgi:hypothetical protein
MSAAEKIRCDACPVLCYIADGRTGACDRYANVAGELTRVDPLVIIEEAQDKGTPLVPFAGSPDWDGDIVRPNGPFVTAIGAGTTYPDYKPAPFIVSSRIAGVDMVTVVSEAIFSYCGAKVKIDTDRHVGPERALVRCQGEAIGHVTTGEYGSQMLSIGGVHHLTGGSKKEGRVTCDAIMDLCNRKPVEMTIDDGVTLVVEAGRAPIVNGEPETRMRVGCGSATIGMFAKQWFAHVDDVVVVDDHITGVLSEHQAGKVLGAGNTGIRINGRKSTPGRYFQVAEPGTGWGGTNVSDPLSILREFDPKHARPGLTLLMVSTTGDHYGYFVLDEDLRPVAHESAPCPAAERRAHPGELRAGAVFGHVHRRRGRQSARRGDGEPGQPDPLGQGHADVCLERRGAGVRVAGRRHHVHGGRDADAGQFLRLRADPGHRGAHRVHAAAGGLSGARRAHGRYRAAGGRAGRGAAQRRQRARQPVADGPRQFPLVMGMNISPATTCSRRRTG